MPHEAAAFTADVARQQGQGAHDGALIQSSRGDLVQDDVIALQPQLADRLVHNRRAGRSRVRGSGVCERGGCRCSGGERGEEEALRFRTFRVFR